MRRSGGRSLFNLKHKGNFVYFPSGYRVNKPLVRFVCGLLLLYCASVFHAITSHERFYLANNEPYDVQNPFFGLENKNIPSYVSDLKVLPSGFEAGYKHNLIVANANVICIIVLFLAFAFNHVVYARTGGIEL